MMWPSVPVARSNAEQCRVVPSVVPTVVPTDIRQHSAVATALAPPNTPPPQLLSGSRPAHISWSPAVRALVTMTTAPITPDLVEWLLADQKVKKISIMVYS